MLLGCRVSAQIGGPHRTTHNQIYCIFISSGVYLAFLPWQMVSQRPRQQWGSLLHHDGIMKVKKGFTTFESWEKLCPISQTSYGIFYRALFDSFSETPMNLRLFRSNINTCTQRHLRAFKKKENTFQIILRSLCNVGQRSDQKAQGSRTVWGWRTTKGPEWCPLMAQEGERAGGEKSMTAWHGRKEEVCWSLVETLDPAWPIGLHGHLLWAEHYE